ncbi:quinone-dependent dihydroorotate dehydrogenase [soil metagenome]
MTLAATLFPLARPLLGRMDAERAHRLTIAMLKIAGTAPATRRAGPRLATEMFGLRFPNPLGLAAGFDKNGEVPDAMLALGFGFVEVGSVTPLPQAGNPQPRLFRLTGDEAVINRMGFNNEGHEALHARLDARRGKGGIVGVNLGANKESADRVADYVSGVRKFAGLASYLTINVSSPNTPGLRNLQARDELANLLARINAARGTAAPPLFLKISPDLPDEALRDIAAMAGQVDAVIVSNTTIARPPLLSPRRGEAGGLSGKPLFDRSTGCLARLYSLTEGRIPLIGVGGISSAETAWHKIRAGASLLQLYTALVFNGPALIDDILLGLVDRMEQAGARSLAECVGRDADRYQGLAGT